MPRDHPQVRRNGPYAPLSATYADDDAIARLDMAEDDRTELLFVRALAFCARDPALEGFVSTVALKSGRILRRRPRKGQDVIHYAEQLVKVGLWLPETDGYRIRNWAKWNRTPTEIEAARKKGQRPEGRRQVGRRGDGRWRLVRTDAVRNAHGLRTCSVPNPSPRAGAALQGTTRHCTSRHVSTTSRQGTCGASVDLQTNASYRASRVIGLATR
jgi:hypothetical protein